MIQSGKRNDSVRLSVSVFFVFALCTIATCWVATQYLAAMLRYQPGLGEPVLAFRSGVKIYQPFSGWIWSWTWMNETGRLQDYVMRTTGIHVAGMFLSVAFGFYLWYRRSLTKQITEGLHGTAKWASLEDVQAMRFVSYEMKKGSWPFYKRVSYTANGVYLGALDTPDGRKVLRYDESAHVLAYMPSRSGKGVGLVVPTLLSYPHSTATNDLKRENFELTSGFHAIRRAHWLFALTRLARTVEALMAARHSESDAHGTCVRRFANIRTMYRTRRTSRPLSRMPTTKGLAVTTGSVRRGAL